MTETFTARVVASHGRHFFVDGGDGRRIEAVRKGKKGDVAVGDWAVCLPSARGQCRIERILGRTSLLFRSDEWRTKALAANIDLVAVVYAPRPTPNPWFVWRALLAARHAAVPALVIRNKTDLDPEGTLDRGFADGLRALGAAVIETSAAGRPEDAKATLEAALRGHATLLVGQSGMGKSTILNLLVPEAEQRTREYSEALDLGKQTTTTTEWFETQAGAIVDSPGFQDFGLAHMTREDMVRAMPDIAPHAARCRFSDCRHDKEPGCAVKEAVTRGEISQERYAFLMALTREALARKAW